jgi:hypothetical protein
LSGRDGRDPGNSLLDSPASGGEASEFPQEVHKTGVLVTVLYLRRRYRHQGLMLGLVV